MKFPGPVLPRPFDPLAKLWVRMIGPPFMVPSTLLGTHGAKRIELGANGNGKILLILGRENRVF
jgi:hypothetical protein